MWLLSLTSDTSLAERSNKEYISQGLAANGWNIAFYNDMIGSGIDLSCPTATRLSNILTVKDTIKAIHPSQSKPYQTILTCESHTINQNNQVC